MFLLRMSAYLAQRVSELNEGMEKERFILVTLVVSQLFAEVSTCNHGFGEFGAVGSFYKKAQDYFLEVIWEKIEANLAEFHVVIDAYH